MHPAALHESLEQFVGDAAGVLQRDLEAGAEVGFELESQRGGRGLSGPALYCYKPLTAGFIADRLAALERLDSHAEAARVLGDFDGLDRYLASVGIEAHPSRGMRVRAGLEALLRDAFHEQTEFELRPERLRAAIGRLDIAGEAEAVTGTTLVATLAGLTIASERVQLTSTLAIVRPHTLTGLPPGLSEPADGETLDGDLVAVLTSEEPDTRRAVAEGRAILTELLRALRLFGDGRVSLGRIAWARIGGGAWNAVALGAGGRPQGMLVVTADQEDELRAFCNLVSRRSPDGNPLAWALRRYELACERASSAEALSDYLLALRALLEPEGPASAMLPGRLAALCAEPGQRARLNERAVAALALERAAIAGEGEESASARLLVEELANHLRALLRDVICGHLDEDLAGLADEILLEAREADAAAERAAAEEPHDEPASAPEPVGGEGEEEYPQLSVQEVLGEAGEPEEVLDVTV